MACSSQGQQCPKKLDDGGLVTNGNGVYGAYRSDLKTNQDGTVHKCHDVQTHGWIDKFGGNSLGFIDVIYIWLKKQGFRICSGKTVQKSIKKLRGSG